MLRTTLSLARASVRLTRLGLHIGYALGIACVYPAWRPAWQSRFRQRWARGVLQLLNVRYAEQGTSFHAPDAGSLLVANHISWLDIFVINAAMPAHFVAKSEVGTWPVLGWLVQRSGTLFVRRDRRSDAVQVNGRITRLLQRGESVAVFAQGTSTDATQPVQFHAALLQSAIDAETRLHPLAVYYHDAHGRRLAATDFVGETSFLQSLWRIACTPRIDVTLTRLPAMDCAGQHRRTIAAQAQQAVNARLMQCARV